MQRRLQRASPTQVLRLLKLMKIDPRTQQPSRQQRLQRRRRRRGGSQDTTTTAAMATTTARVTDKWFWQARADALMDRTIGCCDGAALNRPQRMDVGCLAS